MLNLSVVNSWCWNCVKSLPGTGSVHYMSVQCASNMWVCHIGCLCLWVGQCICFSSVCVCGYIAAAA